MCVFVYFLFTEKHVNIVNIHLVVECSMLKLSNTKLVI